jgi:hypothetical protein
MMSTVCAAARRTTCQWKGQARHLQGSWAAICQRSGQGTLNAEAAHRPPVEWTRLIKCGGNTLPTRRRVLSAINAEVARPRSLTSGSARWLTSRAVGHAAASGLRLSGEWKRTRYGLDTCQLRTPTWPWSRLGILCPGISGPCCECPGPCTGGSGTRPRGPGTPVEVLDLARRSGPYV